MLLEVNYAWVLISRMNSFPRVGVAKAECQARSRISQFPYLVADYCAVILPEQLLIMPIPEDFVMASCC